jgi:hypothetical protein
LVWASSLYCNRTGRKILEDFLILHLRPNNLLFGEAPPLGRGLGDLEPPLTIPEIDKTKHLIYKQAVKNLVKN